MSEGRVHVLLDDDELILASWALAAQQEEIELMRFRDSADLFSQIGSIPREAHFYIDAQLKGAERGEEVARRLYLQGYRELFLVTGYPAEYFAQCSWLRGVLGKDPPFRKSR